jgi:putative ABC transport system permease protein
MRRLRAWLIRLGGLFNKPQRERELAEELESHLQMHIEDNLRSGMTPEEARRQALIKLGGIEQTKERYRDRRGVPALETLLQDLRFGSRMLAKNPGFTAVVVLTLALGIGANTAIFSAVYAVLLKPLPFKNADRLVFIEKKNPPRGWVRNPISPAEILAWRNESGVFEDVTAYTQGSCVLTGSAEAEEDPCETVSGNLFPMLGVTPLRGRTFSADEDKAEGPRVAILSYGLWERRFGADESVIGRAIELNGASTTVVGVMPANLSHLYATPYGTVPELWVSGIGLSPVHTGNDYFGIGRLKPGISLSQAEAQMDPISVRIGQEHPDLKGWRAEMMSLRTMLSGDTRSALAILMGAVIFVLLIACANIANLLLARGAGRANEFAVRNSLGASQGRIIRQLLTESLVISLAGGVLGFLLASWGCKALVALAPPFLLNSAPALAGAAGDSRVLASTLITVLATTFLFGLAPALQSARPPLTETLKETGRTSLQSPRSRRFRSALVVSEIALATVLLVGAGLMVRTLTHLGRVNLGINPVNVLTLRVPLSGPQYKEPQASVEFWRRVVESVEALPGVESASVSRGVPIGDWAGQFFTTADQPNPPAGQVPDANYVVAGPDYFRSLQIPLLSGRSFNAHDTKTSDRVVIVNEQLARTYWPGKDPLGKRLRMGPPTSTAPWLSVVGVAGNVLSQGPDAGFHAEVYVPYQQFPWVLSPDRLIVRTAAAVKPESVARAVVQEAHRVDKDQPLADIRTMEQVAREPMAQQRMMMALLGAFAGLALVLSALGIYSVLSYTVAQRTREIGVRVALGAQRGNVLRLVVGGGVRLAILGIAVGIAAGLALTRLMTDLLYGVQATDPVTFGAVTIILAATSLLACYLPARRATKVDPMVALRYE